MKTPKLVENDIYLEPYNEIITKRIERAKKKELELVGKDKLLHEVMNGYLYYGLHRHEDYWMFREWAPNATHVFIVGAFSGWLPVTNFELKKISNGNWKIKLPTDTLKHGDLYKLAIFWKDGNGERIPAWTRRVYQVPGTIMFNAQVWEPEIKYTWKNKYKNKHKYPLVYEAHVGMSSPEGKVSTYDEFRIHVLPHIAKAGYNTIQLMAIQEHPYYASFGYHVSSFFAVSFRQGTPDELKHLVDDAHGYGISVIMDLVHSHSVKNDVEGLSRFDGTLYQYFHDGTRGLHPAWDSRCFNYSKNEVLHFLLSNCKYWLDEFHFDGYRFDGVTSMLYNDHGLGTDFLAYDQYFDGTQDEDAITYLILANKLIHEFYPNAISVAEEMSGMPGLAAPLEDGGYGFDYRLAMGVPDFWIRQIKETMDEFWHVGDMFYRLTDKRNDEKVISYVESHDQALVGDQTMIFRLIGKYMYSEMHKTSQNILVDRGIALHKMIRLLTAACAGNGYLNFMGNEFGHPEWIDFPREGNNWSYDYARRQWPLIDNYSLRFHCLNDFDKDMISIIKYGNIYNFTPKPLIRNNEDQVLLFKRGKLYFVFNFSPTKSYVDYGFILPKGNYHIVLNSDSTKYNGFNRIEDTMNYATITTNKSTILRFYIPNQSCFVFEKKSSANN